MKKLNIISDDIYVCPDCGKKAMHRVTGFCRLDDTQIIDDLERLFCYSCRSDFFDLSAMKKIRRFRENQKVKILEAV
ncbi:hypothetical protein H8E88_17095 [candidate division KSB1 bacterium]|nr:hypothetical protein [candidate division KSB1 bacterium]